jgi:hypothetical protein
MASQKDPIRLFICHSWVDSDEYSRVFEYLEAPGNFYYRNTSEPHLKRPLDREAQREDLRRQIALAEVVVVTPRVFLAEPELITFEMTFAKAADKPVVALEFFGSTEKLPKAIQDMSDEVVGWNDRALTDALRRQARHEETTRWDTIEFKLD